MAKKRGGIMNRLGRAVGSVAAGFESATSAEARKDVQRRILAAMAADPDASDTKIARAVREALEADGIGKDDVRHEYATPAMVERTRRALAVAALERKRT